MNAHSLKSTTLEQKGTKNKKMHLPGCRWQQREQTRSLLRRPRTARVILLYSDKDSSSSPSSPSTSLPHSCSSIHLPSRYSRVLFRHQTPRSRCYFTRRSLLGSRSQQRQLYRWRHGSQCLSCRVRLVSRRLGLRLVLLHIRNHH